MALLTILRLIASFVAVSAPGIIDKMSVICIFSCPSWHNSYETSASWQVAPALPIGLTDCRSLLTNPLAPVV
jgi:hypothetical protein